jgi:thiamine biosynthesis lipoprotein ApbE
MVSGDRLSRRWFLSLPLIAPVAALRAAAAGRERRFHHDHVIGTSLDLAVWTSDADEASRAESAVLAEVERLRRILSTYDADSEISRWAGASSGRGASADLAAVLGHYHAWGARTSGAIALHTAGRINVDALGKAYIVDRALAVARRAAPSLAGAVVNIGGDLAITGGPYLVRVTDPGNPGDNARPIARLSLAGASVATSGTYARGAHLVDPGTRRPATAVLSATVMAPDTVTANALATALCVLSPGDGVSLVERTAGAEALLVPRAGGVVRTSGFSRYERQTQAPSPAPAARPATAWPEHFEVALTLTLRGSDGFRARKPYVAVWAADQQGKLTRILALWGNSNRWLQELSTFFRLASRQPDALWAMARATRAPGRYQLGWDGLDDAGRAVPKGTYQIVVEVNQEHGYYARQSAPIACGDAPATATIKESVQFDAVAVQYGPRPPRS